MPYINQEARDRLMEEEIPLTPGELNYLLTEMCQRYLTPEPSYSNYNTIIGALECCKLEFYRRMAVPYEDKKIAENGDVYEVSS